MIARHSCMTDAKKTFALGERACIAHGYRLNVEKAMISVFRERRLGDRKAAVGTVAKQIGARSYKLWEHHKLGNLEEVKVGFYK